MGKNLGFYSKIKRIERKKKNLWRTKKLNFWRIRLWRIFDIFLSE